MQRRHQAAGTPEPPKPAPPPFTPFPRALPPLRWPGSASPVLPLPVRREEPAGEERRRPDTLQLWQERERRQQQQQQHSAVWGAPRKDRYGQRGRIGGGPGDEWKQALISSSAPRGWRSSACAADPTSPSFSSFLKLGIRAAGGGAAASSAQASYKYVSSQGPPPRALSLHAVPLPIPSNSLSVCPQRHA